MKSGPAEKEATEATVAHENTAKPATGKIGKHGKITTTKTHKGHQTQKQHHTKKKKERKKKSRKHRKINKHNRSRKWQDQQQYKDK